MRNLNVVKALCLVIPVCLFINSCKNFEDFNEIEEVEYGGEYALPLINSTSSLQDLLDEVGDQNDLSGLIIDEDGSMKVAYQNEPISKKMSDFFEDIPDFPLVIPFNSNEFPVEFMEGISVQQMNLMAGTLAFDLESNYTEDIDVLITIPNLTKDGVAFNVTTVLTYTGSSPTQTSTGPISLEGYILNVANGTMEVYYQAVNSNGDNLQINPIFGMAENWQYDYLQGIWQRDTFALSSDTLNIDLFDNWVDGEITFADPRLDMVIDNSFGFTTMAQIEEMKIVAHDGTLMNLESDLFDQPLQLNYPSIMEPNESKQTVLAFNNTNSNIADILNARPKQIIYSLSAVVNPAEETNTYGFMTNESAIGITLGAELPIHGTASGFEMEEPLETDLSDLDEIEWAEFKIITDNGLPIDLAVQLYFTDDAGNKIDSLYSDYENVTVSAEVNGSGDVINSTEKVTYIEVNAERMEKIKQSNNLVTGVTFSTANNGATPVKILTSHELNIKVGMKVGLKN